MTNGGIVLHRIKKLGDGIVIIFAVQVIKIVVVIVRVANVGCKFFALLFKLMVEIGTEKNTTIVFPLPLDILSSVNNALQTYVQSSENKKQDNKS